MSQVPAANQDDDGGDEGYDEEQVDGRCSQVLIAREDARMFGIEPSLQGVHTHQKARDGKNEDG